MRVGLIGASGFLGRHLRDTLVARGDTVVAASLRNAPEAAGAVCDCDAVVNLAGEPIAQRWTPEVKERLHTSRVEAVHAMFDALAQHDRRPSAYVSASAVGYYPPSETATYTESSAHGNDFLGELCAAWEREAERASSLGMRTAIVRMGVVLGRDGGALGKLLPVFRNGLGGIVGSGRQWLSWVHVDDATGIVRMVLDGERGVFNATAPHPVTNAAFTQALAKTLRRPAFFAVPTFALRLALGEGAEILLQGQRVLPERTLQTGYTFRFATIDDALRNLAH
ncbi:MAG TPA: TIGR01777 family oxidoreductase [Candidatus Acidoferrales bacterium]|nr:TIGR01777 family oxidoreductase [Candidatus Acidoferrales bacterium]